MSQKVFLAHGFRKESKKVVQFFAKLLQGKKYGFEVITGEPPIGADVMKKITEEIMNSDIVIGLFDVRHQCSRAVTTIPYVISELGYALGKCKKVGGFIDKNVTKEETGLLHHAVELVRFDATDLNNKENLLKIESYLKSFSPTLDPLMKHDYRFLQIKKEVFIHTNGYGVIRYYCSLECLSNTFCKVKHGFGLDDNARKGSSIPAINKLIRNNFESIFRQAPFLNFKLISGKFPEEKVDIVENSESTSQFRSFHINFPKGSLRGGDIVTYEFAWGFPTLFPITQEHFSPGFRKKDVEHCTSSLSLSQEVMQASIILNFDNQIKFIETPFMEVYDTSGNRIDVYPKIRTEESSVYTTFRSENFRAVPGSRLIMKWKPRVISSRKTK
jgi:hypothetical protein